MRMSHFTKNISDAHSHSFSGDVLLTLWILQLFGQNLRCLANKNDLLLYSLLQIKYGGLHHGVLSLSYH